MKKIPAWASIMGIVFLLTLAGCHSKDESSVSIAVAKPDQAIAQEAAVDQTSGGKTGAASATPAPTEAISAARNLLKTGNVDEAAARLAQLQIQGATFNAQQAKDYRQALSEAYDRAIEAAQRGDPKAQTAIQLLRAAAPR
jgi:hypothetical protein